MNIKADFNEENQILLKLRFLVLLCIDFLC